MLNIIQSNTIGKLKKEGQSFLISVYH